MRKVAPFSKLFSPHDSNSCKLRSQTERLSAGVGAGRELGGKQMAERVMYSWDDDRGSHSVCSDFLIACCNAATCRSDTDPQVAIG